jgi:hypothetical protein
LRIFLVLPFPNIFNELTLPCGYRFSTFSSTSCEVHSKWINSTFLIRTFIRFHFRFTDHFSIVSAGCKVKKLFEYTKAFFKTFILFFFLLLLSAVVYFSLLFFLSMPLNLPENRLPNSKLYSHLFSVNSFVFSGCKGKLYF